MLLLLKEFLSLMLCAVVFSGFSSFRAGCGCNFSTWETNGECDLRVMGLHEQPHFRTTTEC